MRGLSAVTLLLLCALAYTDAQVYHVHEEHVYRILYKELTVPQARQHCASLGMKLAYIDSGSEQMWIIKMFHRLRLNKSIWLDGTRQGSSKNFYWHSSGRPFRYTFWDHGEPNNWFGWQNCVQMRHDRHWRWDDERCDHRKYALCEKEEHYVQQ